MQKALSINPSMPESSPMLAYNMGRVFSLGYTMDKAMYCLETALQLKPDFEEARRALEKLRQEEAEKAAGGG